MTDARGEGLTALPDTSVDREPDFALVALVTLANDYGWELGVTLTVDGSFLSGKLIGGYAFRTQLVEQLAPTGESGEALGMLFTDFFEEIYPDPAIKLAELDGQSERQADEPDQDRPHPLAYLHLKNVLVIQGPVRHTLPWWSGRLVDVSGWTLGEMTFLG